LCNDVSFVFVIVLRAKAPSLVTHDEAVIFVIERTSFVMEILIVTSESSLMNTFLVVDGGNGEEQVRSRSMNQYGHVMI
jgi:hypothetical protein